jgi:intracellular multiplication protein IcmE
MFTAAKELGASIRQHWRSRGILSEVGGAGPRRIIIISTVGLGVVGLGVALTLNGRSRPPASFDARMKSVDALPGGLHSTPEQDALADLANTTSAQTALRGGISYTPPIAPSVAMRASKSVPEQPAPTVYVPPQPHFVGKPAPVYQAAVLIPPAEKPVPAASPATTLPIVKVAQDRNDQQQQAYEQQMRALLAQWAGRAPRTDVVLPPQNDEGVGGVAGRSDPPGVSTTSQGRATAQRTVDHAQDPGQVLIPAGRGIYAHPVLALSSDQASPAVFQADSGPIAGDRMIGSFSRQNDRLIIHINSIIHQGQPISADGVVTAPDTLEASVASDVDQHYAARFLLPAAAAFVQGLGAAIATTSNTAAVLSPFGGATTTTHLNIDQQLGVAAGAAAANIGSTLSAAAPKGPTISLEANVAVGVMFLSDVIYKPRD